MVKFKNELSWSASRAKEFDRCRREYFYSRYGSWGWWEERPRGEKYQTMILKNLVSLPAFTGTCMHEAIERWYQLKRDGVTQSFKELYESAVEIFRAGWRESMTNAWKEAPNKKVHFEDHHYQIDILKEQTEKLRKNLEKSAQFFLESKDCQPAREAHPDSWRSLESMSTYQFLGIKVYAVPDFAYIDKDGVLHIWDWKTGKQREDDIFQLHSYALYACEKWQSDPEQIMLHAGYLNEEKVLSMPADFNVLSGVQDKMSASIKEMMEVHFDPDEDPVLMENWPRTPDEKKCRRCQFREICKI